VLLVPRTDGIRIRKGRHRSDRPLNRQEIVPVQADDLLEDGGQPLGLPAESARPTIAPSETVLRAQDSRFCIALRF